MLMASARTLLNINFADRRVIVIGVDRPTQPGDQIHQEYASLHPVPRQKKKKSYEEQVLFYHRFEQIGNGWKASTNPVEDKYFKHEQRRLVTYANGRVPSTEQWSLRAYDRFVELGRKKRPANSRMRGIHSHYPQVASDLPG